MPSAHRARARQLPAAMFTQPHLNMQPAMDTLLRLQQYDEAAAKHSGLPAQQVLVPDPEVHQEAAHAIREGSTQAAQLARRPQQAREAGLAAQPDGQAALRSMQRHSPQPAQTLSEDPRPAPDSLQSPGPRAIAAAPGDMHAGPRVAGANSEINLVDSTDDDDDDSCIIV